MKKLIYVFFVLVVIIFLGGCTDDTDTLVMSDFSDNILDVHKYMFSEIVSVVLYQSGEAIPLENDDPRVIRLLNYLTYAIEVDEVSWIQGALTSQWMEDVESDEIRLEIEFCNDREHEHFADLYAFDKLIVTNEWCSMISYIEETWEMCYDEHKYAVAFSPFAEAYSSSNIPQLLYEAGLIQ